MTALEFLQFKFPLWNNQIRGQFNTVSLREENLIEAMDEYVLNNFILFGKWLYENNIEFEDGEFYHTDDTDGDCPLKIEDLYKSFYKDVNKT